MRLSFLIPAFNEESTIDDVLRRVAELDLDKQVIVVDDGSTDGTGKILERWEAGGDGRLVIRQPNRGKGAAVRAAIPHLDGDIAVIQGAAQGKQITWRDGFKALGVLVSVRFSSRGRAKKMEQRRG